MRVALVGADLEENLGVGMIAAMAELAGHATEVVPLNEASEIDTTARRLMDSAPDVVGLSVQFQHRAAEFLALARRLRALGYGGHLTCGGQFSTMAWRDVLGQENGVDSVVLYDGEETFAELLAALRSGQPLEQIPGLALPATDGAPTRTAHRGLVADLDALPFPKRYRHHALHAGVPFNPVQGGRGCWGRCRFCSITSFYRDARAHGGGRLLRHRSPENIAAEMALLWHRAGGRAVFCFHDDNLLLPRPEASLQRMRAIRAELDRFGVGRIAIVGKCRPDSMNEELAFELRRLGVVRLFVGVENASQSGSDRLGRGVPVEQAQSALAACNAAGIFCCYNLLIFEPGATLDDIEQNVDFIRRHAHYPINFCRAEAYVGTELQRDLDAEGMLGGNYLAHDYRMKDDRAELLFRICAAAFRQRNFARRGVHNRYMGLGYTAKLLEAFTPEGTQRNALIRDATDLTRAIALETAAFLDDAIAMAREIDPTDHDTIERETLLFGLRLAAADRHQHAQLDRTFGAIEHFATGEAQRPDVRKARAGFVRKAQRIAQTLALAGLLGTSTTTTSGCDHRATPTDATDPPDMIWPTDDAANPPDMIWPTDDAANQPDMIWPTDDAPNAPDIFVNPDAGADAGSVDAGPTDAKPNDVHIPNERPQASRGGDDRAAPTPPWNRPIDQWGDTAPKRAFRSRDIALFAPPIVALQARRLKEGVEVRVRSSSEPFNTRWESSGALEGEGPIRVWHPQHETDQLRVGVRAFGGVAVAALRAKDLPDA